MRFNYDRSVDTQPLSAAATDLQQRVSTPVNGALELLHIFSPNLVNEAKFGFNRATSNTYNLNKTGILYQIAIATGPGPGFITQNYDYDSIYVGNSFSWIDNLTWVHGRHTLKFGAEIRRIQLNQRYGEHGKITFSTVEDLAANLVSKSQPDRRLAGQPFAQERLLRLRAGRVQVAAQSHPQPGRALHRLRSLPRGERVGQPVRFRHLRGAGILRRGRQLRPAELRRYRSPRGLCLDAAEGRPDGDSRRIRHLPRRRTVGRSESARQKRSALLFGERR